ncbi:hypothetical protein PR001_g27585, partial [Phytophthora rubi]
MGFYYVGTYRNDRLGWPVNFELPQKKRSKRMARGSYRIAQCKPHPSLVAVSWMDAKPASMLATGCATIPAAVSRKEKGSTVPQAVPCPQLVADYRRGMSGVDQHDQLRLQRYSIQRCIAFKKYYRQFFFVFVDMTVLNGFIIHKLIMKKEIGNVPTHAEYMRRLHVELLGITGANLRSNMSAEDLVSTPMPTSEHQLQNQENYYSVNGQRKHRQHLCKVCSALAPPKTKGLETSYFCRRCTEYHGGYI